MYSLLTVALWSRIYYRPSRKQIEIRYSLRLLNGTQGMCGKLSATERGTPGTPGKIPFCDGKRSLVCCIEPLFWPPGI